MPKLPPPPRIAQNRSGFSRTLTWISLPSAVTISAEIRLSIVMPNFRVSQPNPPPSVRPAMPVVELMPVGSGKPEGLRFAIDIGERGARSDIGAFGSGVDAHRAHQRQIDQQAAIAHRAAGDVVAAAANRDVEAVLSGQVYREHHIG